MDEPTNDLDAETLDLLEDLLMEYPGTLLLVSHDREFLNNVVSSTLVLSGDGSVREFVGGYDDWLSQAAIERTESSTPAPAVQKALPEKGKPVKEKVRKLSFKDQRELEALPEQIAAIEKEQEHLHARLSDPDFYKSAGAEVVMVNARLADLDQELEAAFLRWDELESLKA
jgi:ATP-binding cassette subfamily F protein uup